MSVIIALLLSTSDLAISVHICIEESLVDAVGQLLDDLGEESIVTQWAN